MKGYSLNKMACYFFAGLFLLANTSCKEDIAFQKINFDWTKDDIAELSQGFKPEVEYDYWACLRSGFPDTNSISILYETKNLNTVNNFKILNKGFFEQGHHSYKYYYIVAIKDGVINYITDIDKLLDFFGEIDTMEEALMIAINDFGIDSNNPKGGSYRPVKNGFEFLLMKGTEPGLIEFRQYLVSVDRKGFVKSEKREIYCSGYEECYE